MERLTFTDAEMKNIDENFDCPVRDNPLVDRFCEEMCAKFQADCPYKEMGKKLKAYEDAEEQGLILRLPVAEGSTVFVIDYMFECKYDFECPFSLLDQYKCEEDIYCEHTYKEYYVREVTFNRAMTESLGKTVYLTKKEAEQKLADMKGE